jgi:uncharacterized protein (DUF697 family)/GTP-binding protein EngB required for normal cell division
MFGFSQDEEKKFEEEYKKMQSPRPTVLVCGWTGSGKSSLIKTMLVDVDAPISDGTPCTQFFDVYENDLIRVYDSKGMEKGESVPGFVQKIDGFIKERRTIDDIEKNIHLIWYAVDAVACRFDDGDAEIAAELFKVLGKKNFVFVLTKCDAARKSQLEGLTERIKEKCDVTDQDIIPVCDEEGINNTKTDAEIKNGVNRLLNHSHYILPEAVRDAWTMAQKVDIEKKLDLIKKKKAKAIAIITSATVAAGGAAAVPIPIGNTVAITGIQLSMVTGLAAVYSIGLRKEQILPFVAAAAGRQAASSLLTLIPGLGSVINAGVASAFTGGIGAYCNAVFEKAAIARAKGEKITDLVFDIKQVAEYIKNYKK